MKKLYAISLLFLATSISACGTLPVKYEAQNIYRIPAESKAEVSVGKFTYVPFQQGDLAANQIHNTAMGRVYISTNVDDFVKRANGLELEKSGFRLAEKAKNQVQADIIDFTTDDLGYSIDWKYKIKYRIVNTAENKTVFEKIFEADPTTTGKFTMSVQDFSPSANSLILSAYDKFIHDAEAQALLLNQPAPIISPEDKAATPVK